MKGLAIYTFMVSIILCFGCSKDPSHTNGHLNIPKSGHTFQLVQRTEIALPSDSEIIYCCIDDITKGRTLITFKKKDEVILNRSIGEGDHIPFLIHDEAYTLSCTKLKNKLIGEDYGVFKIMKGGTPQKSQLNESDQIEALIQTIEESDVIFIRNGDEYSPQEAAKHMRKKWNYAKDDIHTLDDFIENIASKSSMSGSPYQVKLKNGSAIEAKEWYSQILNK